VSEQWIADYLAASAQEQVIQVDEHDRPLGIVKRERVQREGLITRCTYIFVYNSAALLCMHRRTAHKRLYPGFWDLAAGGLVAAGETYREGAERELEEELGISGVPLKSHGRFFYQSPESRLWGGVYSCRWDGPIRMQPEEVMDLRWIDTASSWRREGECYTPDSLQALLLVAV
tara:strand:- start:193190 stop:193711 length:522 start_codon:yes stop_codon:yes gene_type:complete